MEKMQLNEYFKPGGFVFPNIESQKALDLMKDSRDRAVQEVVLKVLTQLLKRIPTDAEIKSVEMPKRSNLGGNYFVFEGVTLGIIYSVNQTSAGPDSYSRYMEYTVKFVPNEMFK